MEFPDHQRPNHNSVAVHHSHSADGASTYRSVAELADDIGLSERSTRSALRRGEIPHIRLGRRFILPKAAIAAWLRSAGASTKTDEPEVLAYAPRKR
jgi:excisionase family DNA binding protein